MKRVSRSFKIIVDTNIWISFLIGKTLKGLQNYLDNKTIIIITCKEQIQELTLVFEKPKMKKYFTTEQIAEFFELLAESSVAKKGLVGFLIPTIKASNWQAVRSSVFAF